MERIVFLDRYAVRVALPQPTFAHEWIEYPRTTADQVVERLRDATIAITNQVPITAQTLDAVPTLRLVAVAATGYDHIDMAACGARDVTVCNVRHWSITVPEHVFALILALRRQLLAYREAVASGAWGEANGFCLILDPLPMALSGSTLGLIGYGALAKKVERMAEGFEMRVLVAERRGAATIREGRVPFERVLAESHVLVTLCPLSAETRGLISAPELAAMKRDAILVNCARGGIVDETALLAALRAGTIAGAGLDGLTVEPPRDGHPLLDVNLPNLIVTPHIAWASNASLEVFARKLIDNLEAFVTGEPQNMVRMRDPSA